MSASDESARWSEALAFTRACALEDFDAARAVYDTTIGTGYGLSLRIAGLLIILLERASASEGIHPDEVWARLATWTPADRPRPDG